MKLTKTVGGSLRIKPLSQVMVNENKSEKEIDTSNPPLSSSLNEAKALEVDEEGKKAISVLNKWMYELLNNGGDNANDEKHRDNLWYFSKSFRGYIKKALSILDKVGLTSEMPLTVEWAKSNTYSEVPMLGKNAADAYAELRKVSNWNDLQLGELDFIETSKNPDRQSHNDDDEDYD